MSLIMVSDESEEKKSSLHLEKKILALIMLTIIYSDFNVFLVDF